MENYPSNNPEKQKRLEPSPEAKKVEPVVTGTVQQRKKPLGKKFSEAFITGSAKSAGSHALWQVIVPKMQDLLADAGQEAWRRLIFGDDARSVSSSSAYGRTNYQQAFRHGSSKLINQPDPRRPISQKARATHDFDEIVLETRVEANAVLEGLYTLLSQYGVATVGDLYDLCNISREFTNEKWGWTSLQGSGVAYVNGGYLLNLPKPEALPK